MLKNQLAAPLPIRSRIFLPSIVDIFFILSIGLFVLWLIDNDVTVHIPIDFVDVLCFFLLMLPLNLCYILLSICFILPVFC